MTRYDAARGVLVMTMEDWKKLHKDFKGTELDAASGKRYRTALHFVPGRGTAIVPVEIAKKDSSNNA